MLNWLFCFKNNVCADFKTFSLFRRYSEAVVSTSFIIYFSGMKTKIASNTETDLKSKIQSEYLDFVLTEGKNPTSVYLFAKRVGIAEAEFYQHYNSFDAIALNIWEGFLQGTIDRVEASDEYAAFTVRERILTFYFTVIETLKGQRSYVAYSSKAWFKPGNNLPAKKAVEKILEPYFEKLVNQGFETGELADRTKISDYYQKALIVKFWFLLNFWLKDMSKDFEDTDAAIEKAVNLGLDLMKENTLDKAFDFAKFLIGRRK